MPFCTKCGYGITDDAKFCASCGGAANPATPLVSTRQGFNMLKSAGIELQAAETIHSSLIDSKSREGFVLSSARLFHLGREKRRTTVNWVPLRDTSNAGLSVMPRDKSYFVLGVSSVPIAIVVAVIFPLILVIGVVLAVGFLVAWWWSGGNAVISVQMGSLNANMAVPISCEPEAVNFLNGYFTVKDNGSVIRSGNRVL